MNTTTKLGFIALCLMTTIATANSASAAGACAAVTCVEVNNDVYICGNGSNVVIQVGIYNNYCTGGNSTSPNLPDPWAAA